MTHLIVQKLNFIFDKKFYTSWEKFYILLKGYKVG